MNERKGITRMERAEEAVKVSERLIFVPPKAMRLRCNCREGLVYMGQYPVGKELTLNLLAVQQYYGELGLSPATNWLQVWVASSPLRGVLPPSTVFVMYLKTRSIDQLQQAILLASCQGDPRSFMWRMFFRQHNSMRGSAYYSVAWEWREPQTPEESDQIATLGALNWLEGQLKDEEIQGLQPVRGSLLPSA